MALKNPFGSMSRTARLAVLVGLLAVFGFKTANASLMFAFEQDTTGDVLVVMTMNNDTGPYTHTNISSFEFTAAGSALFGLPVGQFARPFTRTFNGNISIDANGGLQSSGSSSVFVRTNAANFIGGSSLDLFELQFFPNQTERLVLDIDYPDNSIRQTIGVFGDWVGVPIPEPATLALFGIGAAASLGAGAARQRRKPAFPSQ